MTVNRKVEIDAVLSEDVSSLINELGIREQFEQGDYNCHICNDVMHDENLKLIFPTENRDIGFVCSKPKCFVDFVLASEE